MAEEHVTPVVVPEPTGPTRGNPPLEIVCCYVTGQLREETEHALFAHAYNQGVRLEFVWLQSDDPHAYGYALASHWRDALDGRYALAIVEPDIVVRPDVIDAFLNHPADYVCFPYAWKTDIGPALGCNRWSHSFIARYPDAMDLAVATRVTWQQLDVVFMRHILAREYGQQPTVLLPPVEHLNEAKALLPEASREPLMSVPLY